VQRNGVRFGSGRSPGSSLRHEAEKAKTVSDEIVEFGGKAFPMAIDVTKRADHLRALDSILENFNDVDILINGAGTNVPTPFFDVSLS